MSFLLLKKSYQKTTNNYKNVYINKKYTKKTKENAKTTKNAIQQFT